MTLLARDPPAANQREQQSETATKTLSSARESRKTDQTSTTTTSAAAAPLSTSRSKKISWREAAATLEAGGAIGYPTDTVYGIGCLADDAGFVRACLAYKGDKRQPVCSALFADVDDVKRFTLLDEKLTPMAAKAVHAALPGKYTFILPVATKPPSPLLHICGPGPSLGCRVIDAPEMQKVLKAVGRPLLTTSLNISGEPPAIDDAGAFQVCQRMGIDCVVNEAIALDAEGQRVRGDEGQDEQPAKRRRVDEDAAAKVEKEEASIKEGASVTLKPAGQSSTLLKWDTEKAKFVVLRMGSGTILPEIEAAGVEYGPGVVNKETKTDVPVEKLAAGDAVVEKRSVQKAGA